MLLDVLIEKKKQDLYKAIATNGITNDKTVQLSEQLDKLIVIKMRRMIA